MSNYNLNFTKPGKPLFEKKVTPVKINYGPGKPNIEKDSELELTELQKDFRNKARETDKVKNSENNTEFWSCIIFETQEQRDEFYRLIGVKEKDNQYVSGKKLIKAMNVGIETGVINKPKPFKVNKDILDLSIKPDF